MPPGDLAPVLVTMSFALVGVIAILVKHQQKMAMILHGKVEPVTQEERMKTLALTLHGAHNPNPLTDPNVDSRLTRLEGDMQELKQLLHQQTLMLDTLTHSSPNVQEIRQRAE